MSTTENKKEFNLSLVNMIALIVVGFLSGAGSLTNSAIQKFIEAFPEIDPSTIRLCSTLPSLLGMIVTMAAGSIVGKKIKFRTMAITGYVCILVGGVTPYFLYTNWYVILVFRAILGCGMGCLGIRNALVMRSVDPSQRTRFTGFVTLAGNMASVILSPIVGALADKGWRNAFLVYSVAIIFLVLMITCLKEPPQVEAPVKAADDSAPKAKEKMNPMVFVLALSQFIATVSLYPLLSGMATFMNSKGIGSAAIAGTILSLYTGGGAVASLVLPFMHKIFKKNVFAVFFLLVVIGQSIVLFVPNVIAIGAGTAICGMGYMTLMSSFQISNGRISTPGTMSFASTIIVASVQAGVFLSSYYINASHAIFKMATDVESAFYGCIIINAIMVVVAFLLKKKLLPDTNN